MSWDSWSQRMLTNGNNKCADVGVILGLDGTPWAVSGGEFSLDSQALQNIKTLYASDGLGDVQSLKIGGEKYMILRKDENEILCKCGNGGMTISKAKTCYVIGIYKSKDVAPGNNNTRVSKVREELENAGF